MRGIGWDFGRDVYVPPRTTSTKRKQFLFDTALNFLAHFLAVDLCDSLLKLVPGVGSPEGGSMFLPHLPPHLRYALSTSIHVTGGLMVIFGIEAGNDFVSLLAVGILGDSPEAWYPLYDSPWRATSLHDFWGRRWHQILRHMFLSFGGYPGMWLGGKAGLVLGTFFASGMFHALGLQMSDPRVVLFFLLQGVGVLLEDVYRRCTGRRVDGPAGWCWTALCVVVLGQICSTWRSQLACVVDSTLLTLFRFCSGCVVYRRPPWCNHRPQRAERRQASCIPSYALPRAVSRTPMTMPTLLRKHAFESVCT